MWDIYIYTYTWHHQIGGKNAWYRDKMHTGNKFLHPRKRGFMHANMHMEMTDLCARGHEKIVGGSKPVIHLHCPLTNSFKHWITLQMTWGSYAWPITVAHMTMIAQVNDFKQICLKLAFQRSGFGLCFYFLLLTAEFTRSCRGLRAALCCTMMHIVSRSKTLWLVTSMMSVLKNDDVWVLDEKSG